MYRVRIGKFTIPVESMGNALAVKGYCPKVRRIVEKLTYGVKVYRVGDRTVFIPSRRSGLTELGKAIIRKVAPRYARLAELNQISMIILAIVVGLAVLCSTAPNNPICRQLATGWEKVILPLLAFGIGVGLMYKVIS